MSHLFRTVGDNNWQSAIKFTLPPDRHYDTFAPVPATCDGAFVASWHGDIRPYIGLVGRDFMPKKPIYVWPASNFGLQYHLNPQLDPTAQRAA